MQVTENTAIILDECGILTTYRGETFVKGAGYIKTYFVPLDEHFNLIRKENSLDFYRIEDRTRYYDIRNNILGESSDSNSIRYGSTFNDSLYGDEGNGSYDDVSIHSQVNEENNRGFIADNDSYASSEPEIKETRC